MLDRQLNFGFVALVASLIVFSQTADMAMGRTDPLTGRIRLLHIGLAFLRPDHPDPIFLQDPKIDLTMVPAFSSVMEVEQVRRMLRIYIPRSRVDLARSYDLVLIDGVDAFHVNDAFLRWTADLVRESDLAFVMSDSGSGWSFAGSGTSWYITSIEPILSVDDREGREGATPGFWENNFQVVPVDPDHELMRNIPWEDVRFTAMNRPTERQGASVVARMSDERPVNRGKPVIVYWDFPSGGRSVSYVLTWHTMVGTPGILAFYRWPWHYDVLVHMIYWPTGEPIPEDLTLVHGVREMFSDLYLSKLFLIATIEFAEKAGANMRDLEVELVDLDEERRRADRLYIENRISECYDLSTLLLDGYEDLVESALREKDRALLWIFAVQWVVVSATSMSSGALLWTLLIRRRFYRDVGRTRLIESG
jgi:hypothetical protein